MPSKKSQMELLGLGIVVVLILVGAVFIVKFFVTKQPSESRKDFVESETAASMINAIINTDVTDPSGYCSGFRFREVIIRCVEDESFLCNSRKVCSFLEEELKNKIFKNTFEEWRVKYQFLIDSTDAGKGKYVEAKNFDCLDFGEKYRKQKIQPLPTNTPGLTANVHLYICG